MAYDYDVLVIGSGFGGSVSALRLTEKGYRVGVLEAGRRFADADFARTSWRVRDYVWAPALGCYGILRLTLLHDALLLTGTGVGGGSLGYANTLYRPPDTFYADPRWASITDWKAALAPCYDQASRMLGVVTNPVTTPADEALRAVADDLGAGHTFRRTPVGILFGPRPGTPVPDPFFGGAGPERRTCTTCGACMTGCRVGAKNTLVKNYLYLAEQAGATVHPLTTVTAVRPLAGGGYRVTTRATGGSRFRGGRSGAGLRFHDGRSGAGLRFHDGRSGAGPRGGSFTARQVILAAGALGTQRLLLRLRDDGLLPHVSPRLGELSRTNSESILGARTRTRGDLSRGIAITSSFHADPVTHIEPVRYGAGSNLLALLSTVLVDDAGRRPRWVAGLVALAKAGRDLPLYVSPRRWSQESVILLGMQPLDNSITLYRKGVLPFSASSDGVAGASCEGVGGASSGGGAFSGGVAGASSGGGASGGVGGASGGTLRGWFAGLLQGRSAEFPRRRVRWARLTSRPGAGEPNPVWVPAAHDVARRLAAKLGGVPMGAITELAGRPVTGHFIGGCTIGTSPATGVVDPYLRLYGHSGLHVIDGSVLTANPGVNPSLTIAALAEYATARWPNAGTPDPRPPVGAPYRPVPPIAPLHPAVPATAPAALRL